MKKENLIQLLRIVEQIENDDSLMMLTEQSLVRSELLQLSDEEAQVILKSEALRKQFLKIKLYSEAQYRLLDHFIQQEIVDRLYFISEPEILSYALRVATNAGVLKRNDVLALIETIADTEKVFQAEYASEVAIDPDVLKRGDALWFVQAISQAELEFQARNASDAACVPEFAEQSGSFALLSIILNAKESFQALYASEAASLPEVLEREDALDLVRSVANMETEQQAAKWLENMKQVNSMKQSNMKQEPLSKLLDQEEIKNTVFFLAQLEEEEVSPHTFVKMRK